ncbi:hypothetical protein EPK99_20520 [Neorhizobium lilium]|uniref:Uncharacterized protein n=1 Tax=Neorhizobium lilium TaxID=2503024 RepID=A0A3S3RF28_9HYPH|nr:hypothetical protein [Neorhizobium lilium]RWX76040.1 hypothetical protein EPK99_20520 [Neorhizobium lilium]
MAEIVVLNKWRAQRSRRPQVRIGESEDAGEIVFFTGVRYERYQEHAGIDRRAENHAVRAE